MLAELLHDLHAEQAVLDRLLAGISVDTWDRPTPAAGWTVRDQVAHLAYFDELAALALAGGDRVEFDRLYQRVRPQALGQPGAGLESSGLLAWWRRASASEVDAFSRVGPGTRVPWGPNVMAAPSLCTARLMETWAHGLDCFAALGVEPVDTARLRHICHLAYRAIPHAFTVAEREQPAPLDQLHVQLTGPTGEHWQLGPVDAPQRIEGTAGEFARLAVQRMGLDEARSLRASGDLATAALKVLRAYL